MKKLKIYKVQEGSIMENGGYKSIYNILQVDIWGNQVDDTASCVCTAKHLAVRVATLLMSNQDDE